MPLVAMMSDLHGHLPTVPACDLLLIAGDVTPGHPPHASKNETAIFQRRWLENDFNDWLGGLPAKSIVLIAGNHDTIFQDRPDLVPALDCHYLQDSGREFEGLMVYGTPWQRVYNNWAFNLCPAGLSEKFEKIPEGIDILVSHSPPFGFGDVAPIPVRHVQRRLWPTERVGSQSLLQRVMSVKPKLHVFGHIHEGRGQWEKDGVKFVNATLLDGDYRCVYDPLVLEIPTR